MAAGIAVGATDLEQELAMMPPIRGGGPASIH
jgi:hypothetical protein